MKNNLKSLMKNNLKEKKIQIITKKLEEVSGKKVILENLKPDKDDLMAAWQNLETATNAISGVWKLTEGFNLGQDDNLKRIYSELSKITNIISKKYQEINPRFI